MHLSNSDHMAVYITYQNSDNRSADRKVIYKRDLHAYSKPAILIICEAEDWSSIYSTVGVQEGYNIIENKLTNIINTLAPLRKVVISEKHPISNHALRSLENRRTTLFKKMKKSKAAKSIQDLNSSRRKSEQKSSQYTVQISLNY
jgi:hypothetical protein